MIPYCFWQWISDNDRVLDNVIVGMQCQLLQTGSCRQEAAGRKWVEITNSVTGAHEPVRTHSRSLQTTTCTHTLLVLQTYFDPYVHFDVYVCSYLGLLAPAFVVALVLQATNAQVGRTTGGSPYFPVIIGKSTHFPSSPTSTVMMVILERKEVYWINWSFTTHPHTYNTLIKLYPISSRFTAQCHNCITWFLLHILGTPTDTVNNWFSHRLSLNYLYHVTWQAPKLL